MSDFTSMYDEEMVLYFEVLSDTNDIPRLHTNVSRFEYCFISVSLK
jgi:hypothetical protein